MEKFSRRPTETRAIIQEMYRSSRKDFGTISPLYLRREPDSSWFISRKSGIGHVGRSFQEAFDHSLNGAPDNYKRLAASMINGNVAPAIGFGDHATGERRPSFAACENCDKRADTGRSLAQLDDPQW